MARWLTPLIRSVAVFTAVGILGFLNLAELRTQAGYCTQGCTYNDQFTTRSGRIAFGSCFAACSTWAFAVGGTWVSAGPCTYSDVVTYGISSCECNNLPAIMHCLAGPTCCSGCVHANRCCCGRGT
jgi:hypothetical protein